MPKIAIIFHSTDADIAQAAGLLHEFLCDMHVEVRLHDVVRYQECITNIQDADLILFGSRTSYATVSAGFKAFMEATSAFWYQQSWRNKFAAGFTVSPFRGGDAVNTLQTLAHFAAYHGMHWISAGVLPRFINGQQTDGQNRFASFLGLILQTTENNDEFHPGDLLTMELFAKRMLEVLEIHEHKQYKINNI